MKNKRLFKSAFAAGNLTPEQVLEFHRARFGNLRMEADDDSSHDDISDDGSSSPDSSRDDNAVGPNGFPEKTPVANMTAEQQVAYWKHQSRKHEKRAVGRDDYDQIKAELEELRTANLSDTEKAIEDAKKQAAKEARDAVIAEFMPRQVASELKASFASRGIPANKIDELIEFTDHTKFLTENGEIDTDKVSQYAESITPVNKDWPDTGGGKRGSGSTKPSVQSGYDRYAERHSKKKRSA